MKVEIEQLQIGCITTKNIEGLTIFPIIKANTVLTEEHLTVLKAFMVESVEVKSVLANGEKFEPSPKMIEVRDQDVEKEETSDFVYLYLKAVRKYKKHFMSWQMGKPVDLFAIGDIFIPLFERIIKSPNHLLDLHHYCSKEDYLFHHSVYVSILSAYLGWRLQYATSDWYQIGLIGALADAGMAKVSPTILNKSGSLTAVEYDEVKKHPIYSYKMLKGVTGATDIMQLAVLQHHERYDGSGYPIGSKAKKIHMFSQLVAVADVYHAMSSERYYRSKRSPYQVLEEISKEQFGKFEIRAVEVLMQSLIHVSIGNKVRLTSGEMAKIIFFDQHTPTRPMVKLLDTGRIIQLTHEPNLHIEEIIL
ncbi:HD-GYP domain-containing protein [bacterium LRH843]|nr:HD-GYP domain-containing protein [bacterium LRH843]